MVLGIIMIGEPGVIKGARRLRGAGPIASLPRPSLSISSLSRRCSGVSSGVPGNTGGIKRIGGPGKIRGGLQPGGRG
jgi:hypothetical protein